MYRYAWVARVPRDDELSAAPSAWPTIPVLRPAETARARRWEDILAWYELQPAAPHDGSKPGFSPSDALNGDLIVSLDDEFTAVAAVLAAIDGRPLIQARDVADALAHRLLAGARSILLVGRPPQLRNRILLELSCRLRRPWGILTARDAPALSFAVAKVLAGRRQLPRAVGHLDAIARRQWLWPPGGTDDHDAELHPATTWATLSHAEWDTLSIHCHGDGAHANFNSVVLCGLADGQEIAADGQRAGCALDEDPPRCKRVHGEEKQPFRFGDLRARRMCLFTCNGFSVAGDVYPSDASFVLSATEGYPAAVLTTDRRLRFEPWLFPAVHTMLEREESLAAVTDQLNDLSAFTEGARPFLLYGDPAPLVEAPSTKESASSPNLPRPVYVSTLGALAASEVIGLANHPADVTVARGATMALVADADNGAACRLVDRTEDLEWLQRWVTELSERVDRAKLLEAAIRDHSDVALSPNASAVMTDRAELARISDRLQEGVGEGTRLLAQIRRSGVWTPTAETWTSHMRLLIAIWDHQLAALIEQDLMERHLSELLRDGFPFVTRVAGPPCPRCGCAVMQGTSAPLRASAAVHHWIDCPTCGPREAWDSGLPRLSAHPPATVVPGTGLQIRVDSVPTATRQPLDSSRAGLLVAHLKDSGFGRVSFRGIARLEEGGTTLTIPVPGDSAPEIHTLRLAFVCSLAVSYLRLRTPGPAV